MLTQDSPQVTSQIHCAYQCLIQFTVLKLAYRHFKRSDSGTLLT